MPAAIIGGALAAGGAVAGAAISSSAAGNAADKAAQASAANNALQRQIYQQNTANLQPWMTRGNAAGAQQSALLGLGGDANAAKNAFNKFTGSDGYQFRLGQGLTAVNNNYATMGALNSGAALKALNDYAQGQASNEFGRYMGYLDNLDQRGMAAGSAIAGVGQNYANAVSSNNNNAAGAAGNAAIASGNAWSNALGSVGGGLAQTFGSSYGGGGYGSRTSVLNTGSGYFPGGITPWSGPIDVGGYGY